MSGSWWGRSSFVASPSSPSSVRRGTWLVFHVGPLGEEPLDAAALGIPGPEALGLVQVQGLLRAHDPRWFDGFKAGAMRTIAERDLGRDLSDLDAADQVTVVRYEAPDGPDHRPLQAAWGAVRWLVHNGANVVLDAVALRYLRPDGLRAPAAGLDLFHEFPATVEPAARPGAPAPLMHTRGLAKCGQPDLVAYLPKGMVAEALLVPLYAVVRRVADGERLTEGSRLSFGPLSWTVRAYRPGQNAGQVHLNNDGWLLDADRDAAAGPWPTDMAN